MEDGVKKGVSPFTAPNSSQRASTQRGAAETARANQFFKLGNVARLSDPTSLSARTAERQWGTLQSEKVIAVRQRQAWGHRVVAAKMLLVNLDAINNLHAICR
jgi:hypothetical protein